MPSTVSTIGGLTLPIPAGIAGQRVVDPAVDCILAFLGWTLRDTLDARLAMHTGLTATGTPATAVATANQFGHSPLEPRAHKVRLPVPSLFLWWDGDSISREWTVCYRVRERQLKALWMFPELASIDEMQRRRGLWAAADSSLARCAERGRHPLYGWTDPVSGTVHLPGTPIARMISDAGTVSWEYMGGQSVRWGIEDSDPASPGAGVNERTARDWPGLAAKFRLIERIEHDQMTDPADVNRDMAASIYGADSDTDSPVLILERIAGAPDGSEEE